jgi:predicted RNase H-like HicB family nuclease
MQSERTYSLSIERHEDGYLAYFPALPGCHTWGVTFEDAVRNAEEALRGYLEALRNSGQEAPAEQPMQNVSLGLVVTVPTIV